MTNEEFKKTLWDTANKLRGSVSAAEYKHPVLGLVFLKYVSDMFDAQAKVIRDRIAEPASEYYIEDPAIRAESAEAFTGDKTFYDQDNVFWVPPSARFDTLLAQATAPDLAQKLDRAMGEIEAENPTLKGVLYREFSRLALQPGKLGELMGLVARLNFDPAKHGSRDVFGEVYEYFLGQFAMNEGAKAGEFYTPKSVVNLLVEILAPFKGTIYDPACGSGGMFVQSARFKDAHQKKLHRQGDLAIHGQELMAATRRLCLMNLAVHGLDGNIGQSYGSSFTNDQHKTLRADYILANPPFNISDWDGDKLTDDPRWVYGIPPKGNANFAWLQHMLARLSNRGRAGTVLANGSMSSQQSGEGDIRRAMVQADVVECMVAMPGQLFSNTQIPACLWFLSKDKKPGGNGRIDRSGQILFIDARKQAHGRISRTQVEFTDEDLQRIAQTYHRWRGTDFAVASEPLSPQKKGKGEGSQHAVEPLSHRERGRGEGSADSLPSPSGRGVGGEGSGNAHNPNTGEGSAYTVEPLSPLERGRGEGSGNADSPNRGEGTAYANVPGFCYSATLAEVEKNNFVLTPGRYVGAVAEDDDDEAFAEKMERLTAQLAEQMAKGAELDAVIREKLGALGYGV